MTQYKFRLTASYPNDFIPSDDYENDYYQVTIFREPENTISCKPKHDELMIKLLCDTLYVSCPISLTTEQIPRTQDLLTIAQESMKELQKLI